jgi:hypothetical protein
MGYRYPIDPELVGKPKGMKRVLQERGLWNDSLKKQCGRQKKDNPTSRNVSSKKVWRNTKLVSPTAVRWGRTAVLFESQDDFKNEVSLLEIVVTQAGHEVIFYPKFHCELNYIEYYWAALKRFTRDNCRYFPELEPTVLQAMDSVDLRTIRRFAMRSKRWMLSYING